MIENIDIDGRDLKCKDCERTFEEISACKLHQNTVFCKQDMTINNEIKKPVDISKENEIYATGQNLMSILNKIDNSIKSVYSKLQESEF